MRARPLVAALLGVLAVLSAGTAAATAIESPADWTSPSVFDHGSLTLRVTGAALSEPGGSRFDVWADSPEATVTVMNHSPGFYHGVLHWHNVPAGSYLESGKRVVEAATATGGNLAASIGLAGGGSRTFELKSNFRQDVTFAVVESPHRVLRLLPRSGAEHPQFAVELGGLGLAAAPTAVGDLSFPTYLMPGLHDSARLVRQQIGGAYGVFGVGPDRVLMLDDRAHRLGARQLGWLAEQLAEFREEGVRRVFACFEIPPFDPRLHYRDGLDYRPESRRIAHLFRDAHIVAIFSGTGQRSYTRTWYGFKEILLSDRQAAIVQTTPAGVSIHRVTR